MRIHETRQSELNLLLALGFLKAREGGGGERL